MGSKNRSIRLLGLLQITFLALLVLRSLTEAFPGLSIYLGPTTVNLSVALVLLMDLIGLVYLGLLWIRGEWVVDRVGGFLIAWVLSLAPWVYMAASKFGIPGLTGVREWIRLLSLVLLYLVVLAIARRSNYERIINVCLLALPIPLAATYYQIFFVPGERAFGVMVHPNNLAAFLVVMIALTIWKLARPSHGTLGRIWWGGLLVVELFALIAPISSNGWLMFGICLITFILLMRGRRFKVAGAAAGAAFIVLFMLIFFQNPNIQREIWQNLIAVGYEGPQRALGGGTLEGRFQMWGELIKIWRERPIQGYGLNTVYFVNPMVGKAAHNDFLRYLVEGGLFALLLFVLFQAAIGRELFRLRGQSENPKKRLLVGIGFGIYLAWVIGSVGDNMISQTVFQIYFWALLATTSAAISVVPHRVESPGWAPQRFWRWAKASGRHLRLSTYNKSLAPTVRASEAAQSFRCPRCQARALTLGDIFCRRCFASLLAPGSLSSLVLLLFLFIGAIGFYLWNQGAGLETFFLGWLLLYVLLVIPLRNQKHHYIYAVLGTAMVGLIAVQWLFQIPERHFQGVVLIATFGLLALALWGFVTSWWAVCRLGRRPLQRIPMFYARHYLLPLGALLAAAYTLNFVLQETSVFIYGEPVALGYILAGLLALFAELGLLIWGTTGERLRVTLLSLAISYGSVLALAQLAVLVSAGALWTVAKLLPTFSATERFAPLLLERPLGLYTWVTLGLMVAMVTSYILLKKRLTEGQRRAGLQLQNRAGSRVPAAALRRSQDTNTDVTYRMQQMIEAHPEGLTLPEIGELLGRDWRGLTMHIKELVEVRAVRKEDRKYFPTGGDSAPR